MATQAGEETTQKERRPSTRRNRDYSVKINWTYELNSALYKCHEKADKSQYGYRGRLKKEWDKCQSKYTHLTSNHLATQVTRVITKGLIRETSGNAESGKGPGELRAEEENNVEIEQNERLSAETHPNTQSTQTTAETSENHSREGIPPETTPQLEDKLNEMIGEIKPDWVNNYEKYFNMNIEDRQYMTKKDRKIEDIELRAANKIMEEIIENDKNVTLWKINVMQYTTAVTLLARHGKLRQKKNDRPKKKTPGWISNFKNKINAIRRKLSHVTLLLNYKGKLTRKQQNIKRKLKRMYGSVKTSRMEEIKVQLTHELKVTSKILRYKKRVAERQRINSLFNTSPKSVYREFRKDSKVEVTTSPSKENVRQFWDNIWAKPGTFNKEASWLPKLRNEYCRNVETRIQAIKEEHFNQITDKLKDSNSSGRDLVVGYWIKHNHSLHPATFELY